MMIATRRALLQSAVFMPLAVKGLAAGTAFAATQARPVVITVAGIGAPTDADALSKKLEPFLASKLPLTLTIDPFDGTGAPLDSDSDIAALLRRLYEKHGDLIEFGIHAAELPPGDAFGQARRASDAQAAFLKLINIYEDYADKAIVMGHTMTTGSSLDDAEDGAGMRAAGVRTIIHLPSGGDGGTTGEGRWEAASTGLVHIQPGAQAAALLGGADGDLLHTGSISQVHPSREPLVLDMSDPLAAAQDAAAAERIASACAKLARSGSLRAMLPGDLPMPDGSVSQRLVVVRTDDLRMTDSDDVAHRAMVEQFLKEGRPVSDAVIPGPDDWTLSDDTAVVAWLDRTVRDEGYDLSVHGWRHAKNELAGNSLGKDNEIVRKGARQIFDATRRLPSSYVPPNNAFDENTLDAIAATGIPVFSAELNEFRYCQTLDSRGNLHASNTVAFEKSWDGDCPYFTNEEVHRLFGDKNDAVFMIHPQTANTPAKKKQIMDMLAELVSDPGTRLVNFKQYRKAVLPAMPVVDRIQSARGKVWIEDALDEPLATSEKDALMRDAELAWRYFDWGSRQFHGVAPGTADREGDTLVGYPFVTMWDVGSQILASISAHRLGLVDDKQFESMAANLVTFIGKTTYDYKGAKLPPMEVAIGKDAEKHGGYDSADTGRLLIALKILDKYANGSLPIKALVESWDLEKTMPDGELHDVDGGRLSSTQDNSYSAYAQRGFVLWGYEVKPIFSAPDPAYDMKDALTTLSELEERGRIATEPLVTEEIELGGSPHSRFAADILYAAQIDRYEATGKLTCISETAIEKPPYFTYQGYQIDGAGGDFVVDRPTDSKRRHSTRRDDALRVINSKGAYLWHAARPGRYSNRLIALIRDKARIEGLGFSAGIHEKSGRQVGLSEINTNGVILEAIDYILAGRRPAVQL